MTPLDPILRELGDEHRREQAPDALGRALVREFRGRHRRPWLWLALAAATATAALAAFSLAPPQAETLALRVAPPAAPEVRFTPPPLRAAASAPKRLAPAAPLAPRPVPATSQAPSPVPATATAPEIATDFFPLRPDPVMEPGEWLRIVRARIPRSELRRFGLASASAFSATQQGPDVAADVVFGNDGTARAIRFIHYTR